MRLIFFILLLLLSSCSNFKTPEPEPKKPSFFGGISSSEKNKTFLSNASNPFYDGFKDSFPINSLLWRSSIDLVKSIPLENVDPKSGIISSNWYKLPENNSVKYKINIYFLSPDLNAMSIKVSVLRKKLVGKIWINDGFSEQLSSKIEELILTRAKELRQLEN